jgi:hypothetical protein
MVAASPVPLPFWLFLFGCVSFIYCKSIIAHSTVGQAAMLPHLASDHEEIGMEEWRYLSSFGPTVLYQAAIELVMYAEIQPAYEWSFDDRYGKQVDLIHLNVRLQ